jgi:DNA-binding CsgD family transcriptional regulator
VRRRAVPHAVLEVIEHLYAALLEPSRWHDALSSFASLVDARAAGVRVERVGLGVRQEWTGLEASFNQAYVEHYWRDDPWAQRIWESPVGAVGHGDALAPRALVEASAFHNDLALPNGFDDLAGGLLERSEHRVVTFGVMRGSGSRRFDGSFDRVAALVAPHLRRALALHDRLEDCEAEAPAPLLRVTHGPSLIAEVEARLGTLYGLTPAEARVAVRVGGGMSPKEIAREHGSSWHTVRAQLRQIFTKTDKRSQSALARLVTLLEASIAADEAFRRVTR